jgi:hypothetical protein
MNIFNLFESPKLGAPSNTPGAQDIGDQHSPSPIGSGTSKREAKKKPVTMMGVGVKESKITEIWEPLLEGQVPNFLDDDFYAYDPETREIKSTWSHKSVGRRHSEYQAQQQGWSVVSGMKARSLGLHYPEKKVDEAGPFSYGTKKPRKGSVADLAAQKRKEQERGRQPVEPKDQRVGTAKVTKGLAEGRGNIEALRTELMGEYLNIYYNALDGHNMTDHIINLQDVYGRVKRSRDPVLQQTYNLLMNHAEENIDVQASAALKAIRTLGDEPNYTPPPRPPMSPEDSARADAFVNQFLAALVSNGIKTHPDWQKNNDKGVAEGSAQDKLHQRHQELRKKSGLPDPNYYKELKATYDLPDEERYAKATELKKKYNVKEGILDRSPAKLPKPRNPAERVLRTKVNAAGQHTNKKRQQQLQPKHRGQDGLDEGWKSAVAGAALAGATALGGGAAQAGDLEKSIGPLPVMATIVIKMPDGQTKTVKKDLGHAYDYKLDDAKKDIENLLDRKGIKQYTIHLDRYDSNAAYLDRDAIKSQAQDYSAKSDYVDRTPYKAKDTKTDYMDKTPYKAKTTTVNYVDKAKSGEFRDMANYESIEEMDRRGFLKALGGAALAGAGVSAAAQQVDTIARVIMIVDGEQVERVINLGPVSSPQAAERALANELRARGIEQFQINLERGAPPPSAPVNTRPGPHGARSIAGPGGVIDTTGQIAGDVQDGDWRSAVKKGYKTYQNNKNADMGAIGRAEVKDRIIKGVVGGLGLDEAELNEEMERHLYQLDVAGYDVISETEAIKGADGKRCWKGKRYAGTKNGKDICVDVNEEKKGLYYYVNQRKKKGISRPKSHDKAPSAQDWKDAAKTAKK